MHSLSHHLYSQQNFAIKWITFLKKILNETDFSNIWQTQTFKSIEWLKQSIKQTLLDQFLQDWNSSVHNSPKASNYRIFKTEFKGLGAIRAKIGPTSDVDKISSKMYSQYVLFRNKYS